jgi:MFS family permease
VLKRLLIAFTAGTVAYVAGGLLGGWLVSLLSSNTHDRSIEAAMTGAFVIGPLAAIVGFVAAFVLSHRRRGLAPTDDRR